MRDLSLKIIWCLTFLQIYSVYGAGISTKLDFDDSGNTTAQKSEQNDMKSEKLESFIVLGQPLPKNPKGEFEAIGAVNVDHSTQYVSPNTPKCTTSSDCVAKFKPNSNDDFLLTNVQVQVLTPINKEKNSTKKPDLHDVPVYRGSNPTASNGQNNPFGVQDVPVFQSSPGSYGNTFSTSRRPLYITPKPTKVEVFPSNTIISSTNVPNSELTVINLDPHFNNRHYEENSPPGSIWITKEQNSNSYNPKGFYPTNQRRPYEYSPEIRDKLFLPNRNYAPIRGVPNDRAGNNNYNQQLPLNIDALLGSQTGYNRRNYPDLGALFTDPVGIRNYPGNSFTRISYPEHQKCSCGLNHGQQAPWNPFANFKSKPAAPKIDDKVEKLKDDDNSD